MAPTTETQEAYPMKGGDGLTSYSQNSTYQRGVIDAAKDVIVRAVEEKLDLTNPNINSCTSFRIADYGCSTGPNTFFGMQNVVDAVELKYHSIQQSPPEFQVFFNDHVDNDFNILFKSIPPSGQYFAAGVPGSFYQRVLPKASVHFAHCSYALHWLSKVPKEIQDKTSPAWNKGKIHYTGVEKHVTKAYFVQFQKDMDIFLKSRAEELVGGGLMVLLLPGLPKGETLFSKTGAGMLHALLGASLMDLAKTIDQLTSSHAFQENAIPFLPRDEIIVLVANRNARTILFDVRERYGAIDEDKVDSFNLPQYHPSAEDLKMVIEMNNCFSIESYGTLDHPMRHLPFDVKRTSAQVRAIMEAIVTDHFGSEILDQLFGIYTKKLTENYLVFEKEIRKDCDMFLVLKRKSY